MTTGQMSCYKTGQIMNSQQRPVDNLTGLIGGCLAGSCRCHEARLTDDRHGRIEECLNFKQLMQRNRRGFKLDEIRSIILKTAVAI